MAESFDKAGMKRIDDQLEKAAGGANEWGVTCPRCGSDNISLAYTHDERSIWDCNACGHHWVLGPDA